MDFSGAVQWWDEWQLRTLVLGSLFVQFFLFFSAVVRGCASPPWFRVSIWLAYLGGDALAIYALATLFNRHKLCGGGGTLEVLWAPVLLIHLGGLHPMTAYSIEDNELWRRHAITMVSQVTVALYVFCKSWSGEKRLLQAAILLFIVGIIRCIQKPWALKNASINSMVTSSSLTRRKQSIFAEVCSLLTSFLSYTGERIQEEKEEEHDLSLQEFIQKARDCVQETELASDQEQMFKKGGKLDNATYFRRVFVDVSPPYSRRLMNLKFLLVFDGRRVYSFLQYVFEFTFGQLYTKQNVTISLIGCWLHFLLPFLTLASLIVFSTSRKDGYNGNDVKVTYILFCCTTVLDLLSLFVGLAITFAGLPLQKVSQYSLLSICARNKKPTILMKLAAVVGCKDYVNMHWYTEQLAPAFTPNIIELVLGYVKDGWRGYIRDAASYRRFIRRGQWTLRRHRLGRDQRLGWSLKMAFDKSVLLWHIATDLCFHHQSTCTSPTGQARAAGSRVISNYMAYLLFIRPEMLMPGTRKGIFTVAVDDVEIMLADEPTLDESRLAQGVLSKAKQRQSAVHDDSIGDLVPNACNLAEALMMLSDEENRWKVIDGVWVEMLCYSAGRGSGYQHAKSLGQGAELLSYVWLLLAFMGMETFGDRFQKPEPPETNEEEEEDYEESVHETASEGRAIEGEIAISGSSRSQVIPESLSSVHPGRRARQFDVGGEHDAQCSAKLLSAP